jgi:hypothetical protein
MMHDKRIPRITRSLIKPASKIPRQPSSAFARIVTDRLRDDGYQNFGDWVEAAARSSGR